MKNETLNRLLKPESEFSPLPFWFWNDKLDENEIIRQIREMNAKGVNGFVIHPRIGIPYEIPYMSGIYMRYVKCAVEEAAKLGMKVILYDEGMYPSGSAHGMVVKKNSGFATRGIRCEESLESEPELEAGENLLYTFTAKKTGADSLDNIEKYKGDALKDGYVFIHLIEGFTHGHIRGIHIGEDDWEEPPASADLLSYEAVSCFIELTHEVYYKALSQYFGTTVIGIFTDEPSVLGRGEDKRMKPWTVGFADELEKVGIKPIDIAAMWYDTGDDTKRIRQAYAKAVHDRLTDSFYKQLYDWCTAHGIGLVGHPGKSWDIGLLKYFHIPGQDLVFRRVAPEDSKALTGADTVQAKCSSDSARHRGRRRNLNECFACGGKDSIEWSFNADDMKWTMDWLFIRGVNMLVPHAFFYSLDGERRFGERPPDVGFNNIWWKHYDTISDYIKRMCFMMTDSVNTTSIAVLCRADSLPVDTVKPLYENQIEFNYLEEELISDGTSTVSDGKIKIASQCYDTLIAEDISMLSPEIKKLTKCGVKVIVYNPGGAEVDSGIISVQSFDEILTYLKKDLVIIPECKDLRVSHIIKDGEHFYILVNEGENAVTGDVTVFAGGEISVFDPWQGRELCTAGLSLDRRESLIICAGKEPTDRVTLHFKERFGISKAEKELKDWYIDDKKTELGSWTENEALKDFCGTVCYRTEFEADIADSATLVLDMGTVCEQAEVYVNGEYAGFKLWAPYTLDITAFVKEGNNSLEIKVTNSLANKYGNVVLPSGLLDRVTLKIY